MDPLSPLLRHRVRPSNLLQQLPDNAGGWILPHSISWPLGLLVVAAEVSVSIRRETGAKGVGRKAS